EDDVVRPEPVMNAWRDCGSDAIEWLIGQGIDSSRTGIMGYSLGSHIAVDGALGESRAAAAISVAGGWDVYTPRRPLRRIPVLLISAQRDTHVRPVSTAHWRHFLIENEVPVRARTVRGAGHIMNRRQWEQVYAYALDFFNGNIGRPS
ncbi:MAG TPA: prolyl oligopeptidase family serine peptidase, partial [Brevundimonas sp.]|nr:prolyl oligopeptidase family serine peptidase [Brevundimonas sp.]